MSKKKIPIETTPYSQQLIKALERITNLSGINPHQVFDDFLRMTEATLEALPAHIESVVRYGRLTEDTPETAQLFKQIQSRYDYRWDEVWAAFGEAFGVLLESTAEGLNQDGCRVPKIVRLRGPKRAILDKDSEIATEMRLR